MRMLEISHKYGLKKKKKKKIIKKKKKKKKKNNLFCLNSLSDNAITTPIIPPKSQGQNHRDEILLNDLPVPGIY